jgi:ribosome-binding factor A
MKSDELKNRAKECADVIQCMAIKNPQFFSNKDVLATWFETVLEAEHTREQALLDALEVAEGVINKFMEHEMKFGLPNYSLTTQGNKTLATIQKIREG